MYLTFPGSKFLLSSSIYFSGGIFDLQVIVSFLSIVQPEDLRFRDSSGFIQEVIPISEVMQVINYQPLGMG